MSDQSALSRPVDEGKGDESVDRRALQQVGPRPWERSDADRVHLEVFAQRVQRELAIRTASWLAKSPSRHSPGSPSTSVS
jgi:hypothetical protein